MLRKIHRSNSNEIYYMPSLRSLHLRRSVHGFIFCTNPLKIIPLKESGGAYFGLYRYVTRTNVPFFDHIRTGIKERNIRARNITI